MMIIKKFWDMPRKAAVSIGVCALVSSVSAPYITAGENPQIASTSLCGDSYLLALAPERIAALSWQSRDDVSRANAEQRRLPQVWDDPERIIRINPDIVFFGPGEGHTASRFLSKTSIKIHHVKWGEDFEAVKDNYLQSGKAFSVTSAANRLMAAMDRRLAALETRATARNTLPKILYLSRSGGTAGSQTYVDAAITAAGGRNVIKASGWFTMPPEKIMSLDPDLIVMSFMEDGYESVNANGIRHKVLREFISGKPHLNIPGELWPCAGPGLVEAAELIASELDRL